MVLRRIRARPQRAEATAVESAETVAPEPKQPPRVEPKATMRRVRAAGRPEPGQPDFVGPVRPWALRSRLPPRTSVRVRRQAVELKGLEHHTFPPFNAIVMSDRGDYVLVSERTIRRGRLHSGTRAVRPRYITVRRKQPDLDKTTAKQARTAGLVLAKLFPRRGRGDDGENGHEHAASGDGDSSAE